MGNQKLDLSNHNITVENVIRNPNPARFYEDAIKFDSGSAISDSGALVVRREKNRT